jgi:outer membrane protein assembly factor BamB
MRNVFRSLILGVLLLVMGLPVMSQAFTQYLGDHFHSGLASGSLVVPLVPRWDVVLGQKILSSPVSDGTRIYVGTDQNAVLALNRAVSSIVWKANLSGKVTATPALVNGVLFLGDTSGNFYALRADNGTQVWKRTLAGSISSSALVKDGKVFVGVGFPAHEVVCLDAGSGAVLWTFSGMAQMCYSSPAALGNTLLVGADDGALYCLNQADGSQLWKFSSPGGVYMSSPAIDAAGSKIFFLPGDYDTKLYCLSPSGSTLWTRALITPTMNGRIVVSSPTTTGAYVYLQAAEVIPNLAHPTAVNGFNVSPKIFCLNAADGTIVWEVQPSPDYVFDNGFLGPITIASEHLVVPGVDGICRVLRASSGEILSSVRTNKALLAAPLVSQNNLFLASTDGNLYVFAGQDSTPPLGTIVSPLAGSTVATSVIDFTARVSDTQSGINTSRLNILFGDEVFPMVFDPATQLASTTVESPFVYGTIVATLSVFNNSGGVTEIPWNVLVRDPRPLSLITAEAVGEKTVRLTFNAPLASSSALVLGNYSLQRTDGTALPLAGAAYESTTGNDPHRIILLSLTQNMPPGETLTIEVRNQTAVDGRPLAQAATAFAGYVPVTLVFARAIAPRQILLKFSDTLASIAANPLARFQVRQTGTNAVIPLVSQDFSSSGPFTGSAALILTTGADLAGTSSYQVTGQDIQSEQGKITSFISPDFVGFIAPTLQAARSVALNGILLTFSDPLFSSAATTLPAYTLKRTADGTPQKITQAIMADPGVGNSLTGVLLSLETEPASESYTITAAGLFALDGRILATQTLEFSGERTIRIVAANAIAIDTLLVRFDTPLNFLSITDLSIYTVTGKNPDTTPTLSSVAFGDAWGYNPDRAIRLTFSAPLTSTSYTIGIKQIRDSSGKLTINLSCVAPGYVPLRIVSAAPSGSTEAVVAFNLRLATDSAQSLSNYTLTNLTTNAPVGLKSASLIPGLLNSSAAVVLETSTALAGTQFRLAIKDLRTEGDQIVSGVSADFSGDVGVQIRSAKGLASRTVQVTFDTALALSTCDVGRWQLFAAATGGALPVQKIVCEGDNKVFTLTTTADIASASYRLIGHSLLTLSGKQIPQVSTTFPGYRPASLLWADAVDSRTVRLRFNAPIATASIAAPTTYRLVTLSPPQMFTISGAKADPENSHGILLRVTEDLPYNEMEVSVSGIANQDGAVTTLTSAKIPGRLRQNYFLTIEAVDFTTPGRFRLEVSSALALPAAAPTAEVVFSGQTTSVSLSRSSDSAFQYFGEFSVPGGFSGTIAARVEVRPGLFQSTSLAVQPKSQITSDGILTALFQDSSLPAAYRVFLLPLSDRLIREIFPSLGLSSLATAIRGRVTAQGIVPSVLALEKILALNHAAGPWILFSNDLASSTEIFSPVQLSFNIASFSTPQYIGLFKLQKGGEWEFMGGPNGGSVINTSLTQAGVYALISDTEAPTLLTATPQMIGDATPALGADRKLIARIAEGKNSAGLDLNAVRFLIDNEEYIPSTVATEVSSIATQTVWKLEYQHPTPFAVKTFSWKMKAADRLGNVLVDTERSFAIGGGAAVNEATIYPNPVRAGQKAQIRIRSTVQPDIINVAIMDTAGDRVIVIEDDGMRISRLSSGAWETKFSWDLRNKDGREVANGVYFVRIKVTTAGRTTTTIAKFAVLR